MRLIELNDLISNVGKCEEYLRGVGILRTFINCISCGSTNLGMIRGDRYRCYSCKKEWSRRKDSILTITRFTYSEFLICLKYFEVEFTAKMTSSEFDLNYKTVKTLFNLFRMKMGDVDEDTLDALSGIIKGETDTFGLNYIDGKVKFEFEHTEKDEASVKAVRHLAQRSAAYYDITYKRLKNEMKIGKGVGYIGELDNFWRFAAERLVGYKGTGQKYFILFLKELEFRYNHRNDNLLNAIVEKLSWNLSG